jgi:Flp pilus assembly protein TadD
MVDFVLRHRSHPNREKLTREIIGGVRSGANAYAWVANLMIDRRRLDDAYVLADDGLRHLGPQAVLLKVKGYVYLARRDFDDAVSVLTWAARLTPRDPDILVNLGWAHLYRREPAVAARVWEHALVLDPGNDALRRDLEQLRRRLPS